MSIMGVCYGFLLYGLYHHGFQSFGKEYDTDGDGLSWVVPRIQSCLDLYSFCVFSYHIIPVFLLYIFMGDHSHCRNHLFWLHLQKKKECAEAHFLLCLIVHDATYISCEFKIAPNRCLVLNVNRQRQDV